MLQKGSFTNALKCYRYYVPEGIFSGLFVHFGMESISYRSNIKNIMILYVYSLYDFCKLIHQFMVRLTKFLYHSLIVILIIHVHINDNFKNYSDKNLFIFTIKSHIVAHPLQFLFAFLSSTYLIMFHTMNNK